MVPRAQPMLLLCCCLLPGFHEAQLSYPATAALCLPMDHLMSDQDRPQTRPADKDAAVYGGPSFSQGLEADPSVQGDTGSVDQQQQQEEAPPPLTDTIRMGLDSMEQRRQQLHAMVSLDIYRSAGHAVDRTACICPEPVCTVCLPCMHHASTTSALDCR